MPVRLYRDGLAAAMRAQPRLRVDASAATLLETKRAVRDLQPDVVIVPASFEGMLAVFRALSADTEKSRLLALAVVEDVTTILTYIGAGTHGFVTATVRLRMVESIERAVVREARFSPRLAAQLLRQAAHLQAISPPMTSIAF